MFKIDVSQHGKVVVSTESFDRLNAVLTARAIGDKLNALDDYDKGYIHGAQDWWDGKRKLVIPATRCKIIIEKVVTD